MACDTSVELQSWLGLGPWVDRKDDGWALPRESGLLSRWRRERASQGNGVVLGTDELNKYSGIFINQIVFRGPGDQMALKDSE